MNDAERLEALKADTKKKQKRLEFLTQRLAMHKHLMDILEAVRKETQAYMEDEDAPDPDWTEAIALMKEDIHG